MVNSMLVNSRPYLLCVTVLFLVNTHEQIFYINHIAKQSVQLLLFNSLSTKVLLTSFTVETYTLLFAQRT